MKTKTETVKISYANIEAALASFLFSLGDHREIVGIDIPLSIDEEGLVEVDIEVVDE